MPLNNPGLMDLPNFQVLSQTMEKPSGSKKVKVTFGADPEFLLQDAITGLAVPAVGKFGGSKDEPILLGPILKERTSNFFYLEDGAALEFNTPVTGTIEAQVIKIAQCRAWGDKLLEPYKNVALSTKAALRFQESFLDTPQANHIGCDPDFDAYSEGGKRRAFDASQFNGFRFAGGHLHIGVQPWPEIVPKFAFVQFVDLFLGTFLQRFDTQLERREFYGKPGIFRPTQYGVEYRTPSTNCWCQIVEKFSTSQRAEFFHLFNCFINTFARCAAGDVEALDLLNNLWSSGAIDWGWLQRTLSKAQLTTVDKRDMRKLLEYASYELDTHFYSYYLDL